MLSLRRDLDPALHIAIGKALAPLRDEGVAIIGSGMSYHDLRHFRDGDGRASASLRRLARRGRHLARPEGARGKADPLGSGASARECHPREEHLLPLMVVAGAAGDDPGKVSFRDVIGGKTISGFRFG